VPTSQEMGFSAQPLDITPTKQPGHISCLYLATSGAIAYSQIDDMSTI
jgi:hypothetical protein